MKLSPLSRTRLFLSAVLLLTLLASGLVRSAMILTEDTAAISMIWLLGFTILFFNVAYLFVLITVYPWLRTPVLKESAINSYPRTAIVYPIRDEESGVFARIFYSLRGNLLPNTDVWILSDSDRRRELFEQDMAQSLSNVFGGKVFYRRRPHPLERKQGNLKDFLLEHQEYEFMYVCDGDGMIPAGTLKKLISKALHPVNQDVAIFQSRIQIIHAKTWYARFERIGARFAQTLYFTFAQSVFGRSISFGHHQLVRTKPFRSIELPKGLLSHDNWDTVLLDQMGWRVCFVTDTVAFDEAPSNYLEARARDRRWSRGTLQGIPLIFERGITPASRFLAFYGIYLYLAQFIFFFWVILGIYANSFLAGRLIDFRMNTVWSGYFTNTILHGLLFTTLAVVFGHKLVLVRSLKDLWQYLYELVFSTLLVLNNCLYQTLDIMSLPFRSGKVSWKPMTKDPFQRVSLGMCARAFWPTTVCGLYGLWFCLAQMPHFTWQVSPILLAMTISIPAAYLTSGRIPEHMARWI